MPRRRKGDPIDGVLILDKPQGLSSNAALQRVRRLLNAQKGGHTGSLDPLATGVLPLCFGESTKFSQYLLDADKAYLSDFRLGVLTSTADAEGEVLMQRDASNITQQDVETAIAHFLGDIEQVPPMYSALKHEGQPLYKLARQGVEIERKARRVRISSFKLLEFEAGVSARAKVEVYCSKGTYIRSLAHDIGEMLGCGGHVETLRRTKAGPFEISQAISMEKLEKIENSGILAGSLLAVDTPVNHFPKAVLDANEAFFFCRGQAVRVPDLPFEGLVRLFTEQDEFLGLGEMLDDGRVAPKRLCVSPAT